MYFTSCLVTQEMTKELQVLCNWVHVLQFPKAIDMEDLSKIVFTCCFPTSKET